MASNMKKIGLIIFLFSILFFSCKKNDVQEECISDLNEECVKFEDITSNQMGFYIFDKGPQEFGTCSGIKINEEWSSSPKITYVDTSSSIFFIGFTTYNNPSINGFIQAETFAIFNIPYLESEGCYKLTSNISTTSKDSISIRYTVNDDDVVLANYKIDSTAENKFEVLEFNTDTQKFRGKLKATFITDAPIPPVIPEKVRFFNIEIEIN
jgi:hypothetical protein